MAKRNERGLPLATANPGNVKKYSEKELFLSRLPPVRPGLMNLARKDVLAMYHDLCRQLIELNDIRFQGTMNERK